MSEVAKELELELFEACEKGELPTIRELVENKGVNANAVDERRGHGCRGWDTRGWTPLHYACM